MGKPNARSQVLTIDLTNYKDKVGSRVPEGRYTLQIDDYEIDKTGQRSKNPGTPMIVLYLRVVGGENENLTLVDRLTLGEASMFRFVNFAQALGIPTPRKRIQLPMDRVLGRLVDADVVDGAPFNGRVKSEISGYLKHGGSKADPTDVESDDDDFGGLEEFSQPAPVMEKAKKAKKDKKAKKAEGNDAIDVDSIEM